MRALQLASLSCGLLLFACGGSTVPANPPGGRGGGSAAMPPHATGGGDHSAPADGGAATGGGTGVESGGGASGTGGGPSGNGGGASANPFCPVETVLKAKCQGCHSSPPNSGAPMSLVSYANTQMPSADGQPMWKAIERRISDTTKPMPPSASAPLTAAERSVLADWFATGAKGADCAKGPDCPADPTKCSGEKYLPCKPSHRFVAHPAFNLNAKYEVKAQAEDEYTCFYFKNPFFGTKTLVTAEAPIIDNAQVIHHWLLFGTTQPRIDGLVQVGNCVAPELTSQLIAGWAPGGKNILLDSDVGLSLSDYQFLELQMHYNNPRAAVAPDASGIALCTTNEARPNVAGVVTLGTDNISIPPMALNHPQVGTCNNLNKTSKSVFIIGTTPHMHQVGSSFRTEHVRGGVNLADIVNLGPNGWRFEGQENYSLPRVEVKPNDVLRTTCFYTNPSTRMVKFGTKTTDEMCYNFVLVYPASESKRECGQGVTFSNQ